MNGASIRLWVDKWIPCRPGVCLNPLASEVVECEHRVESIIDFETHQWNLDPIRHAISPVDAAAIQSIRISSSRQSDWLIWPLLDKVGIPLAPCSDLQS